MTHSGQGHGEGQGGGRPGGSWIPDTPAPGQPWGDPWGPAPVPQEDATMNLAPVPPDGADDATRFIPPVPSEGADDATRFIPPVPPEGADDATRFIPPVPPEGADDATRFIPPVPRERDHDETRLLPPVPPPEAAPDPFESLFRQDGDRPESPRAARAREKREAERQKASQLAVMGAVVVACAVLGLGLSAAIYGGDDTGTDDAPPSVAAAPGTSAPTRSAAALPPPPPKPSASASAEDEEDRPDGPARTQAEALDRLLADSNNSRDAVVRSVANIRRCQELGRAATDLRGAAEQRRTLVARLQSLGVDRLPRGGELSAALIRAWQSSAAADDHYASWAEQVQGERGCRDGRARTTRRAVEGNRASADATAAKRQAAGVWNAIAEEHELTERRAEQL
ncbi:hypothetical protein ACIQ9E_12240 [Streptomyces sp. NPDC094448]|uniref:hypothetical protein n=1 Tax=Streptomyces sp. NPDC094448 TaxID=3366063 RepID=UPI00380CB51F